MVLKISSFSDFLSLYESNAWHDDSELILELLRLLQKYPDAPDRKQIHRNLVEGLDENVTDEDDMNIEWTEFVKQSGGSSDTQDLDLEHYCVLQPRFIQNFKKFNAKGTSYIVKFKNLHEVEDLEDLLEKAFRRLLEITQISEHGKIGFELRHPTLDTPILIPFMKQKDLTVEHIVRTVSNVVQSNEELDLESGLECQVTEIVPPTGRGWRKIRFNGDMETFLAKHRCVLNVDAKDGLCLPRALVLSIGYVDNDPKLQMLRKFDTYSLQKRRALDLMDSVGLGGYAGDWGIEHIQRFQDFLQPKYQIKVFEKPSCEDIVFDGPLSPKQLNLLLTGGHFMVITKIMAFLNTSYWCSTCNKCFSKKTDHKNCPVTCHRCMAGGKCKTTTFRHCTECNRWFVSTECFDNHRSSSSAIGTKKRRILSVCDQLKRCKNCFVEYYHTIIHTCNLVYCSMCSREVSKSNRHQCFMQKLIPKPIQKQSFIFFDFETEQSSTVVEENAVGDSFLHRVICAVAHKVCDVCWVEEDTSIHCFKCGQRRHVFTGEQSLSQFVHWLFSEQNRGCIAMAHNGKSFDFQFILAKLNSQAAVTPEIICKGLEIIKLKAAGVTLLDSLNFLPMPLASMPKAFNFEEMKKGHFPHLFSSLDKFKYKGLYPDAYFYSPATMKASKKKDFFSWYMSVKDGNFNFYTDMINYCNSDVDILKRACMTFRSDFMETNQLDPFSNAITVADACNRVFRMSYLQENCIGLIPTGDYRLDKRYSIIAIKWLKWLAQKNSIKIEHGMNGREFTIPNLSGSKPYRVDGRHGDTIFEFFGCGYHGCTRCFRPNQFLPLCSQLAKESFQKTMDRQKAIERQGYKVVTMWECDLKRELNMDADMRAFFKEQKVREPMKARDSYFGGRTNVIKLYHKVTGAEQIAFIDVCSLYPYICKYGTFPCGHPEIITENFENLSNEPYNGLINCQVLPPHNLYHPVLPTRIRGKLIFSLCNTCAVKQLRGPCNHIEEERSFWGSFVTLELYKALAMGYKVLNIAEVWHYTEFQQYHPETTTGIFTNYINNFLKLKQENSDWPDWCKNAEDRAQYIRDYELQEGIKLEAANITRNAAKRALAKLCLNSLYGKFGQHSNKPKSKYLTAPGDLYSLLTDSTKTVKTVQFVSDNKVFVNYIHTDGFEESARNTNVVIAAYVTAQARLKLYTYLEILGKNVLYMDTDSVVFLKTELTPEIPLGDYLGYMTNELKSYGENAFITEWCSCGPKNYAYVVSNGLEPPKQKYSYVVKIKGFTLDSVTGKRLNMRTMKKKVRQFVHIERPIPSTDVVHFKIVKTMERHVLTKPQLRSYNLVIDKRFCTQDYYSYPFGYLFGQK